MTPSYPHKHVVIEDQLAGPRCLSIAIAMSAQAVIWYAVGAASWPFVSAWLGVVAEAVAGMVL